MLTLNNKIITLGGSVVKVPLATKGNLINMNLDGNGDKTYHVLAINGNVAKLLGMSDISTSQAYNTTSKTGTFNNGTTGQLYAGSDLDTYLNTTWYNTLTSTVKAAIVPESRTQYMYQFYDEPNTPNTPTYTYQYQYNWSGSDAKEVTLNGSVGYGSAARTFSNQKYWVYIIGINHNEAKEGIGIAFQGFKTAQTGGIDIAVTAPNYGLGADSRGSGMVMNATKTNSGGWIGSVAYKTIMPQWKACFPSDLQAVIRTTTLYTDNTGNKSTSASAVTTNSNEVYYLAEYEVFGTNYRANTNEPAQQAQYDYYKAGNSKIKYRSDSTGEAVIWWLRSPICSTSAFCFVSKNGLYGYDTNAYNSYSSSPCFKV